MEFKNGDRVRKKSSAVSAGLEGIVVGTEHTLVGPKLRVSVTKQVPNSSGLAVSVDYASSFELINSGPPETMLTGQEHPAQRKDDGKAPMSLLDPIALEGCAQVLAFGAKKYAANNWKKGMSWSRVINSLLRPTFKLMAGEDVDGESGLPHVDHIMCNAMFLANYFREHKNLDDRYKKS